MVKAPGNHYGNLSLADYEDIGTGAQSFDAIIAEGRMPLSVRLDGVADEAWGMLVSTNYLETPPRTGSALYRRRPAQLRASGSGEPSILARTPRRR
jgi:hypothetical protein